MLSGQKVVMRFAVVNHCVHVSENASRRMLAGQRPRLPVEHEEVAVGVPVELDADVRAHLGARSAFQDGDTKSDQNAVSAVRS